MIIQLLVAAVLGGTKDTSAYVRKTAAHALFKVWRYAACSIRRSFWRNFSLFEAFFLSNLI
jgi:hypothetical protein